MVSLQTACPVVQTLISILTMGFSLFNTFFSDTFFYWEVSHGLHFNVILEWFKLFEYMLAGCFFKFNSIMANATDLIYLELKILFFWPKHTRIYIRKCIKYMHHHTLTYLCLPFTFAFNAVVSMCKCVVISCHWFLSYLYC